MKLGGSTESSNDEKCEVMRECNEVRSESRGDVMSEVGNEVGLK